MRGDVCLLLLDELVANAVTHGGSDVHVAADVRDPIRIEVTNHGTHGTVAPVPYERGRPAEHFGLHLVHGLSSSWGVTRDAGDTVVWVEVPHPAPPDGSGEVDLSRAERDERSRRRERSLRGAAPTARTDPPGCREWAPGCLTGLYILAGTREGRWSKQCMINVLGPWRCAAVRPVARWTAWRNSTAAPPSHGSGAGPPR